MSADDLLKELQSDAVFSPARDDPIGGAAKQISSLRISSSQRSEDEKPDGSGGEGRFSTGKFEGLLTKAESGGKGKHTIVLLCSDGMEADLTSEIEFGSVCLGIRRGKRTICLNHDCNIEAHKTEKFSVHPSGTILIRRENAIAFSQPAIELSVVDAEVYESWTKSYKTLNGWVNEFQNAMEAGTGASSDELKKIESRHAEAKSFKTPAKTKQVDFWTSSYSPFKRMLPADRDQAVATVIASPSEGSKGRLIEAVVMIENHLEDVSDVIQDVQATVRQNAISFVEASELLAQKAELLSKELGQLNDITDAVEAVSFADAVRQLAFDIDELKAGRVDVKPRILPDFKQQIKNMASELEAAIDKRISDLSSHVGEGFTRLKDEDGKLAQILAIVSRKLRDLALAVESTKQRPSDREADPFGFSTWSSVEGTTAGVANTAGGNRSSDWNNSNATASLAGRRDAAHGDVDEEMLNKIRRALGIEANTISALQRQVEAQEKEIRALKADHQKSAISFSGLGLTSITETEAWARLHFDPFAYGMVVDVFLLLAKIRGTTDKQDEASLLLTHKRRLELGIRTGSESKALLSLKIQWPVLFYKEGEISPSTEETWPSYLTAIKSYEVWDRSGFGVMDHIKRKIEEYRNSFNQDVENRLGDKVEGAAVARVSMSTSIDFLNSFVSFIDTTHKNLTTNSGFSSKKAWSLTTSLAHRVFNDLNKVRNGAHDSIELTEGGLNACSIVLWTAFRTHDVMAEYQTARFADHPSMSAEYIRFLSVNTGQDKIVSIEKDLEKLTKEVNRSTEKLQPLDQIKKDVNDLKARVKRLEDKK